MLREVAVPYAEIASACTSRSAASAAVSGRKGEWDFVDADLRRRERVVVAVQAEDREALAARLRERL